jgi:hypothetical protein
MKYEETFTAFIDFLGFSEASRELTEEKRLQVLDLLQALAGLRSDFSAVTTPQKDGATQYIIKPAISTFSDHIVISYGLETLRKTTQNETSLAFIVLGQFESLVTVIAAQALRLGFLVRGAIAIGNLYHAGGVVFGEALVEATTLEAQTAVYPRIVLSASATHIFRANTPFAIPYVKLEDDGIYCLDYMRSMLFRAAPPGNEWAASIKRWFQEVVLVVQSSLNAHAQTGKLKELAKWTWFARRFREAVENLPEPGRKAIGISLDDIPWGK